jgi:alpha-beta hydrolase superfamily lysophospholipase
LKTSSITLEAKSSYQIFSQIWEPENPAKGVIILVHGLGEHSGRYCTHFANFFSNEGYSILTFDLPGHGQSSGKKGHIKEYDDFEILLSSGISYAKNKYPSLPIFVYGHSLGGLITLEYSIQVKPKINGVIASAPVLDVYEPIHPAKLVLAKIMNTVFPSFSLDSGLKRNMLSRDKSVIERYNADPLVHGHTSARMGMYIIEKGEFVRNNANKVSVPTLVMVGSAEGIVSKKAIHDFCDQSDNCVEKIWTDLYHELHNEPEKLSVLEFTSEWIYSHL